MTWDGLIEHVLGSFDEYDPADPRKPDTWVISEHDLVKMLRMAVEVSVEHECYPFSQPAHPDGEEGER